MELSSPIAFDSEVATLSGDDEEIWREERILADARSLRALIEIDAGSQAGDYTITVADGADRIVEELKPPFQAGSRLWTKTIQGRAISVRVDGQAALESLRFRIETIAPEMPSISLEALIEGGQFEWVREYSGDFSDQVEEIRPTVGRLSYVVDGQGTFFCTGVLITKDLLLTNEHCVGSEDICGTLVAEFNFELDEDRRPVNTTQHNCLELAMPANETLDFSVLRLEDAPGDIYGVATLSEDMPPLDRMFVVQHPGGSRKMLSEEGCSVKASPVTGHGTDTDIAHSCDTLTGSSGAPVVGDDGKVVALHHLSAGSGFPDFDEFNRAVLMSKIVPALRQGGVLP